MSILHIFVVAEPTVIPLIERPQFRVHTAIPWDEAYELYLDPPQLRAYIQLAKAAQNGAPSGLRGRVFDALRAVRLAEIDRPFKGRDAGPYAVVTTTAVWSRIELEDFLMLLTSKDDWSKMMTLGQLLLAAARTAA